MPTMEEVAKVTNGKGVFAVAITNTGSQSVLLGASVSMGKPPQGCEHLIIGGSRSSVVGSQETKIIELSVPFISTQKWEDIEQYDNLDNRLSLPKDSKVFVEVRNVIGDPCIEERVFAAKYLEGTRLIALPQQVSIMINCDAVFPYCLTAQEIANKGISNAKINKFEGLGKSLQELEDQEDQELLDRLQALIEDTTFAVPITPK